MYTACEWLRGSAQPAASAKLKSINDKWRPILQADRDKITAKLVELDSALGPLYAKLKSDGAALDTKLKADAQALADAQKKLKDDLAAWRAAHPKTTTA